MATILALVVLWVLLDLAFVAWRLFATRPR
jgi:hypothetical protein